MPERSSILAGPEAAPNQARQAAPAPAIEEESALPEVFDVARVPLFGAGGIDDDDADRARRTARLLRDIVPALGLDPRRLRIVVNSGSAAATEARQAVGLELDGVVQFDPSSFDPETVQGRYLLGHELAHSAQRQVASGIPNLVLAEWEAEEVGRAVAQGERFSAPAIRLAGNSPAAADKDIAGALKDTVAVTRKREIERIHKALKHILWISKSDIDRSLKTLTDMDFYTACAVVLNLDPKERYWLVDGLTSEHYRRYRSEIFACYAALEPKQIEKLGESLLLEIDLHELTAAEHKAAQYVIDSLTVEAHLKLLDSKNGPAIRAIGVNKPDLEALEKQKRDALQEEKERQESDHRDESVLAGDAALQEDLKQIKERVSHFFVSDSKALDALDIAGKYKWDPAKMQALAHALDDCGALDRLVKELPIRDLFEVHLMKGADGDTLPDSPRRKAFLMLVANRPPYKNVELAEELTSYGFFDWSISEAEAYLAFQLLRAVPSKSRDSFLRAEEGKYWERTSSHIPPRLRHSEQLNFYGGGKGRMDLASIELPLLDAGLWVKERLPELDSRIRMAIAAGEHEFVFEQSRKKDAYKVPGLKPIVDKYRLYDPGAIGPDGKVRPRTVYVGELLPAFAKESPDRWGSLKVRYSGAEIKHFSLAKQQGAEDLGGVRFKSDAAVRAEENKPGELGGGNFIDTIVVDSAKGIVTVEARVLSIESVRYLWGDMLIQAGEGRMENIKVRAGYPKGDSKAFFMQVSAGAIVLKDVLLTSPGSMTAINQATIRNGKLYSASEHVDPAKQNEGNADNLFERILSRIRVISDFVGLLRLWSNAGDLKKAFQQTAEFSISADDIELTGVTLSSGEHIDSVGMENVRLGKGEQISGYRSALEASLEDIRARIHAEQAAVTATPAPPDKGAREKALLRLQEQKQRVEQELAQVQADQAEIARLEARQKTSKLTAEEETKLANLKRGGTAFDIETVKLKGISGRVSSGDLKLTNVHGQGRQSQFLAGSDARPFLESQADASKLTVDVGDVGVKNLVLKKSPPSAEALARKIKSIQDGLAEKGQTADFRTAEKLAKLQELQKKAARYEAYAKQGAANLSDSEAKDFAQLRTELYEQTSRVDAEVNIEGASIELDFSGGLGALADLRKTLKKATLGAQSLSLKDVSIPGTGFHADEIAATKASLVIERSNRSTSLGFHAQEILVTGLQLRRTRDDLEEQIRQIRRAGSPSPSAQRRLDRIQKALDELDELTARAEEDGRALASARGRLGEPKAQRKLDADVMALKKWQEKLVAQSISVKNLNVRTNIAAGLLSDELDGDDDETSKFDLGFDEAKITPAEGGPIPAAGVTIGETHGTVVYQPDKIQITDFVVASIQIEGLHYSGGMVEVSSKGVTKLAGITAEATISYEKGPGGDVLATTADIKHLGIASIKADNLHYEDSSGKQKLTVDVPSGELVNVSLTDFSVRIPDDPQDHIAATGALDVESIKKLKILAQVKGGLSAEATVDAGGLKVDFLKDGEQTINLRELDVSGGKFQKDGTRATFNVTKLSGQVKRKKDGTTEFEIPIDKVELTSLSWRSEGRSLVSHAPLVLSGIKVTGSMHQNQASAEKEVDQIVVSHLHVTGITGDDITYRDGDTTFRIAKTDPAQKDPATALVIDDVDLTGLTWRPKHKLTIDNLDVRHMAAAFSAEVKASAISASGVVKADRINLKLLKGGKLVAKVNDLSADVKGNVKGAAFKASIQHLKTEATADGDVVTLDPFKIGAIPITQFSLGGPSFHAELNQGDGNNVTFHDLEAKIRIVLNPTPKPGAVPPNTTKPSPIKAVFFDSLVIPSTTGTGFSINLPALGFRLAVEKGNTLKLGKMELAGLKKGGDPFRLDPTSDGWAAVGKLVLADADIQKLGFEVGKSIKGSGTLHAEGGSLTLGNGPLEYQVDRVTVDELEALADIGTFRIIRRPGAGVEIKGIKGTSEGDVSAESGSAKGITFESKDKLGHAALGDINLPKGVRRNAKGQIVVGDGASVGGFTYDDAGLGLHLEFDKVALPKGAKIEPGKSIHTDHVDLHEAKFRIDDLMKLAKSGGGAKGGPSMLMNKDFLDRLEGMITAHILLDIPGKPDFEWDQPVEITGGGINFKEVHSHFDTLFGMFVVLEYDDGSGNFQVRQRGSGIIKQAEVPAAERPAAKDNKRVQLKVLFALQDPPHPSPSTPMNRTEITNAQADLHLNNPAVIQLADGGVITIQSKGKQGALQFHGDGDVRDGRTPRSTVINMNLDNLDAKVEHLKLGGGKEVNATSIAIDQIKDVHLGMTGFTPGKLEGTIVNGSADHLDLILGAPAAKKATP